MSRSIKLVIGILVGIVAIGATVLAMRPAPVDVDVTSASEGPMEVAVDEEGRTRIRERYVVSSPLAGRLRRISLDPGDPVLAESTVLAIIEPTDPALLDARAIAEASARVLAAEAAVRQSDATLESTRAEYDFAENELARIEEAFRSGAARESERDRARTEQRRSAEAFRAAEFGREIATYELDVARAALLVARGDADDDATIQLPLRSPIDGTVLRVMQESVAVVSPGTPLLEVGDSSDLEIVVDVLSTDAVRIRPGQRVDIERWGGDITLEGVVRLVEPSAFTKISALGIEEQRVNVIVDFVSPPESREALGDGFRVEASIIVWSDESTLRIPTSALHRDGERWAVFTVDGDRAVRRHVDVGWTNGRETQVVGGLDAGELVVTHPGDALREGVRVRLRAPE